MKLFSKKFVIGLIIYSVLFLALAGTGLYFFWDFIESYENSRPKNTVAAYMEQLTADTMCQGSQALLDTLDPNIQTPEQACQVIRDSLTEKLTYAKKAGTGAENTQEYVLRCGRQVIGGFTITAGAADRYGFTPWEVTEEHFDFSHLVGESVSITVPHNYQVSINGNLLDEGYITETDLRYTLLEEFYGDYPLPTMVTYTAGSYLGELTLEAADPQGNPVEITPETDMNSLLPDCSDTEKAELEGLISTFLERYILFTGSANGAPTANLMELGKSLVPDGALFNRLRTAIDGLTFAQSGGDTLGQITMNRYIPLDESHYLCDVSYVVSTIGKKGAVDTTNNMKIIFTETADGLKVEAITSY